MAAVARVLAELGGTATYAELVAVLPRRRVELALRHGEVRRARRGRYVSAETAGSLALAHEMSAILSHESAALHHGWPVKSEPDRAHVTVRRQRRLVRADRPRVVAHFRDLTPGQMRHGVTTPVQTVLDCARDLSSERALSVADSALRQRAVSTAQLRSAIAALPQGSPGSARARRTIDAATPLAAGPLESVLRAIVLDVPGFCFVPQLHICESGLYATVDLGDQHHQLALEAEGYAWHGGRREFRRDCSRYDDLVAFGWTVFRFAWEHVMLQPDYVRWCLLAWAAGREGREPPPRPRTPSRIA